MPTGSCVGARATMAIKGHIEAVIFDLGRVLVNVDITKLARGVLATLPDQDPEGLIARVMTDPLMAAYNAGRIGPRHFCAGLCERLGLSVGYEDFARLWCDVFSPIEGMADLVAELRCVVRLGLLSDTDPLHWEYLSEHYPFLGQFDRPTLSFQVGLTKPDPRIYQQAASNVGTPCDRCLYIDDLQVNVDGAARAGMQAVLFEGPGPLRSLLSHGGVLQPG